VTDTIEIYIDQGDETPLVGLFRYVAKRRGQSSLFEYEPGWLNREGAFAIDPENLPLQDRETALTVKVSAILDYIDGRHMVEKEITRTNMWGPR
jgi:hypothetical protein